MFCFASLCQAGTWEDVGEILCFSPPLAEDILPYDRVANIELRIVGSKHYFGKLSVPEDSEQNFYCRNSV